jgi:hypothetical protein
MTENQTVVAKKEWLPKNVLPITEPFRSYLGDLKMEGGGISGTVAFTGAALQCSQGWVRGC